MCPTPGSIYEAIDLHANAVARGAFMGLDGEFGAFIQWLRGLVWPIHILRSNH